jgi:hypothetical protein
MTYRKGDMKRPNNRHFHKFSLIYWQKSLKGLTPREALLSSLKGFSRQNTAKFRKIALNNGVNPHRKPFIPFIESF